MLESMATPNNKLEFQQLATCPIYKEQIIKFLRIL